MVGWGTNRKSQVGRECVILRLASQHEDRARVRFLDVERENPDGRNAGFARFKDLLPVDPALSWSLGEGGTAAKEEREAIRQWMQREIHTRHLRQVHIAGYVHVK